MLQDLSFGKLANEYQDLAPATGDIVFCFRQNQILCRKSGEASLKFPEFTEVEKWSQDESWCCWHEKPYRFLFCFQGVNCFLWMGDSGDSKESGYIYEAVRLLRYPESKDMCFAAMTAWHLFVWYRNNRFCGCCGKETIHDAVERMMRCPSCGNMIFPRISPAVIVAVTDGDRLLLSKYAGRNYARYALIAGYTEIGETLEQTVHREVMEEVGLRVKNIRYYKSQPWGVDGTVLMGFYCDLDGYDTIHLDEKELAVAEWHHRGSLPAKDDGISLTREMIRMFEEGREPR